MQEPFKAIVISRGDDKVQKVETRQLNLGDLMDGDVLLEVEATTINYKDGLAITGKAPVIRRWPMIPGIDCAGTIVQSSHAGFAAGDSVILNGWGVGETHMGAFAKYARVSGDWLINRPANISAMDAMAIGTAGYTSMLCVMALQRYGLTPASGPIVVSGANGGVGSVAISILSKLGYTVIASTGRPEEEDFLRSLGANDIIDRKELSEPGRPLGKERWAGGIDAVGSHTLANMLAMTQYGGAVAACGLAQGMDLPATVMPFILRGIALLGVDSVMAPKPLREEAWKRLGRDLDLGKLHSLSTTIGFDDIVETAHALIDGNIRGRVVVDMKK